MAANLLLPGEFIPDSDHSEVGTYTIATLWRALRVLHAANAEGMCVICPSAEAWESVELKLIREAIEEANG